MQPKRDTRIVFYLNDQEAARLNNAVAESGMERPDWLRTNIDSVIAGAASDTPADTLEAQVALAAAQARIDGLEALVQQQRERQGMSDSLNQELNQRLKGGSYHQRQVSTGTARRRRDKPKLVALLADELTRNSRLESKQRPPAQSR